MSPLCTLVLVSPTAREAGKPWKGPSLPRDMLRCRLGGTCTAPQSLPRQPPESLQVTMASCRSGVLQHHKSPPPEPLPAQGRGQTDRQLFPEGTAGTVPVTTQALLQQPHPPRASNGLRKGVPRPPSRTHCLSPPGHGAHIQPLSSAMWAQALAVCFAHHNICLPSWHSITHLCQHPADTAQLLGATGTAQSWAEPCSAGHTRPSWGHKPNRAALP